MRDRLRAAVVVPRGEEILLVSYHFHGETFWALPGGAPGSGESPEQAARREVLEETGITVDDLRLLLVSDHTYRSGIGIDSGGPGGLYHELGIYFVAHRHSGSLRLGDEPEHGGRQVIQTVSFQTLDFLAAALFYPSHVVAPILAAARNRFEAPPQYLEDRSLRDWIAPAPGERDGEKLT